MKGKCNHNETQDMRLCPECLMPVMVLSYFPFKCIGRGEEIKGKLNSRAAIGKLN